VIVSLDFISFFGIDVFEFLSSIYHLTQADKRFFPFPRLHSKFPFLLFRPLI